jgi:uncharacterized OB-fold protein
VPTATAVAEITFLNAEPPQTIEVDELISISGVVFEDTNRDGLRDVGEPALKGVAINAEMADTEASRVVALTTTNDQGEFTVQASRYALISVQVPEGFRPVTPITRRATQQLAFGLRADAMTVERVVQSPPVNIIAPPLHLPPEVWAAFGGAGLFLMGLAAFVVHRLNEQTQVLRELISEQIVLGRSRNITETNWQAAVEQAIVESWGAAVQADSFLGLSAWPNAWMRFSMKDGRIFTFTVLWATPTGFHLSKPKRLLRHHRTTGAIELHRVFEHFARQSDQPAHLPRCCEWFVCVDKATRDSGIRVVLPKSLRIKAAQ